MKRSFRILSLAVLMSVVMLGAGIQTTPHTALAAPQDPQLEQIEKELEGFLKYLMEVQRELFNLEQRALGVQYIEEVVKIEWENWKLETKIHEIAGSFLKAESAFLEIKEKKVYEAKETRDLKRILLLLKVEEEVALVKAKIAACWLESSMIEEKLAVFKKKFFMKLEYLPDQVNDVPASKSRGCGTPPIGRGSLFQSFTPSASSLGAIDLRLRAGGGFPHTGYDTTARIRSGTPDGPVLGTKTAFVPGPQTTGAQLEVRFEFSPQISLVPGDTYVIEWISPEEGGRILTWMVAETDPCPGGTAFGCTGIAIPEEDSIFITYSSR